mmetsp:Transcript_52274/g.147109  ORF Transcript_52274/g.147109 Transcript_52274/m.147109 type:complete len:405 (+) Transcript_52274:124-1338(+)
MGVGTPRDVQQVYRVSEFPHHAVVVVPPHDLLVNFDDLAVHFEAQGLSVAFFKDLVDDYRRLGRERDAYGVLLDHEALPLAVDLELELQRPHPEVPQAVVRQLQLLEHGHVVPRGDVRVPHPGEDPALLDSFEFGVAVVLESLDADEGHAVPVVDDAQGPAVEVVRVRGAPAVGEVEPDEGPRLGLRWQGYVQLPQALQLPRLDFVPGAVEGHEPPAVLWQGPVVRRALVPAPGDAHEKHAQERAAAQHQEGQQEVAPVAEDPGEEPTVGLDDSHHLVRAHVINLVSRLERKTRNYSPCFGGFDHDLLSALVADNRQRVARLHPVAHLRQPLHKNIPTGTLDRNLTAANRQRGQLWVGIDDSDCRIRQDIVNSISWLQGLPCHNNALSGGPDRRIDTVGTLDHC